MFAPTLQLAAAAALLSTGARAHVSSGRERYGVIGYGIRMYDPPCAYACLDTAGKWMLDCGDMDGMDMSSHHGGATPECKAANEPFLQTVAWCFHGHCPEVSNATLERVWEEDAVGRLQVQPRPLYSFQHSLARVAKAPPVEVLASDAVLDRPSLVDEDVWLGNFNGDQGFENMEITTEKYGIIVMVTSVGLPIVLSWLQALPLPPSVVAKVYSTLVDPPLFGRYHSVPVLGLGFVPTRGQGLFIGYLWIVNIVFSAVGYEVRDPMSWYSSLSQQLVAYISNRVGILSFANLALAVLFSSRNNVLLFVTGWSYATFLLVHRWVAVICMLQACLHSAMYLQIYQDPAKGADAYAQESALPYWIWGIVGTLALVLLVPMSLTPFRQRAYELFLALHVALAILAMIGCLLHIFYRYQWQWGYQTWVWIAWAIWLSDRFLARPLRLVRHGIRRAFVTVIDGDYCLIEVPGVAAHGHAYLYFPTLTWRVWENHPFSIAAISSATGPRGDQAGVRPASESDVGSTGAEKVDPVTDTVTPLSVVRPMRAPGLVILVRAHRGTTGRLLQHADKPEGIPVLVEGSYGAGMSMVEGPGPTPSLDYPNLVCVAGGVGISGVLPLLLARHTAPSPRGTKKLFWGVRTEPLVDAVRGLVGDDARRSGDGGEIWGDAEVAISVGRRFDVQAVLGEQVRGAVGGTSVVVCGPAAMADEVRVAVTALGRAGAAVRLVEESFGW